MARSIAVEPLHLDWSGSDVDVSTINRQIAQMWSEITHRQGLSGAVRTSIFNLVAFADSQDDGDRLMRMLTKLPGRRPSRGIVLVGDRAGRSTRIDAQIASFCEAPDHDRPPLCHEQILIVGHGRAAEHLASVVIPLLLPELPTYLWWPGQPPFGHRFFHRLLRLADQLIVDSAQFKLPGDGFAQLATLLAGGVGINDFNWGRMTPWREVIAQFFDTPGARDYLREITSLDLIFGSSSGENVRATASTLLILGWLAAHLDWEAETSLNRPVRDGMSVSVTERERVIDVNIHAHERGIAAAGRLLGLNIRAGGMKLPPCRFVVERTEDMQRVNVRMEGDAVSSVQRVVPLNMQSDEQLLVDELELTGCDEHYRSVVEAASRLAGREVWIPS